MSKLTFHNLTASSAVKLEITGEPKAEHKPAEVVRSEMMDAERGRGGKDRFTRVLTESTDRPK